jgi:hypothetical protein
VVRADDSRPIDPSELAHTVESGVKLEMSILLWKGAAFRDTKEMCPRCKYLDMNAAMCNGWIEWQVLRITIRTDN